MANLSPLTFITLTLITITAVPTSSSSSSSSVSEKETLLKFKSLLKDPSNKLSKWSINSPLHHCNWAGVQCDGGGGPNSLPVSAISLPSSNLSGEVSSSICDLPHLRYLSLEVNQFKTPFPDIVNCKSLTILYVSENQFYGQIPYGISQLSSLVEFDMESNQIEGIPQSIGRIKTLKWLNLRKNKLSGSVADNVLGNMSALIMLDLSENPSLVSELPRDIGKLVNLRDIYFHGCGFYGVIPEYYSGLPGLENLDLSQNNLTGMIPKSLVLGKNWVTFDVSQNRFSGSLPIGSIFNKGLTKFGVHSNKFNGSIPRDGIEGCLELETFQVQNNDFEGDFVTGVWSLPNITVIRAQNNRFSGEVPESVSKAVHLLEVQIDNNNFTGSIPSGLGRIKSLYKFSASSNGFYGEVSSNLCDFSSMSTVNLSNNFFHGEIPDMKKCAKLVSLSLANNWLAGEIPSSLGDLPGLTHIDLSNNFLTGPIPQELEKLNLTLFNVSYNQLSGQVPSFLYVHPQASFLQGNGGLCGCGLPNLCGEDNPAVDPALIYPPFCLVIVVMIVVVVFVSFAVVMSCNKYKAKPPKGVWKSYQCFHPEILTPNDLVNGMNEKNAQGNGSSFGRYYVKSTRRGELAAVKKLGKSPTSSLESLQGAAEKLAEISHKNIAKLLGLWHTNTQVILVFKFVQRGSLGDLISKPGFELSWEARLKITIGVAHGLAYLHKHGVLHRNVKANNILLNDDNEPMLTDFAIDLIIGEIGFQSCMRSFWESSASSCYLAPETWDNYKATEKTDMYSFGVVMLEVITGKQAKRDDSKDPPVDIVQWVLRKVNVSNEAGQVIDPNVSDPLCRQQMFRALDIALRCISVMPEKRPSSMTEVAKELCALRTVSF